MMPDYVVAIKSDSPVWSLYQRLKKDGVKDADLDTGYPETNYVKKTRKTVHQGDHKIEETEVLNYALEHYERYQLAIKETTGYLVPWSLDDLNPATDFDKIIRDQVGQAITGFKQIMAAKGLKPGTDRYNELLGVSLYAFVLTGKPNKEGGLLHIAIRSSINQELQKEGLDEVVIYLGTHGGLGVFEFGKEDCRLEATALEALAKGCGWCSEQSNVLYAVFRAAGLRAKIMFALPGYNSAKNDRGTLHVSTGLKLGNKLRIFDPALEDSNAAPLYIKRKFSWWFEQSDTESLSDYYNNLGGSFLNLGLLDPALDKFKKAVELNPFHATAHANLGTVYARKGDPGRAIAENMIAIKIGTDPAPAYNSLGNIYAQKNDMQKSLSAYRTAIKLFPDGSTAYYNLGVNYRDIGTKDEKAGRTGDALRMYRNALELYKKARDLGRDIPQKYWTEILGKIEFLSAKRK